MHLNWISQIDGELTLGENIADNGGLREAYYAYKLYELNYGQEMNLPGLEHFTHEQLLFISFGNVMLFFSSIFISAIYFTKSQNDLQW